MKYEGLLSALLLKIQSLCEVAEIAEGGGGREQGEEHAVEILRYKS